MNVHPRRRAAAAPADAGLGLVEVVVAMVVFAVIATGIISSLVITLRMTPDNEAREVAANLAAQEIDYVRAVGDPYQVSARTATQTINGRTYTIDRTTGWLRPDAGAGVCGATTADFELQVNVAVSWTGQASTTRDVRSDTLLAPSSTLTTGSTGALAIHVVDANDGSALAGVALKVGPAAANGNGAQAPSTQPASTGTDGCSYLSRLTPGNYDVTATLSGPGGRETGTSTSVPVAAGGTTPTTISISALGALTPDPADNVDAQPVLPLTLPVSYINSQKTYVVSSASSVAVPTDDNGYAAVAGAVGAAGTATETCPELDPLAWGAGTSDGEAVGSGQREAATPLHTPTTKRIGVPMGTVRLKGLGGLWVKAVQTSAAGAGNPGCSTTGAVLQFPQLGSGDETIALPYGTWTLFEGPSSLALLQVLPVLPLEIAGTSNATGGGVALNTVTLDPRPLR